MKTLALFLALAAPLGAQTTLNADSFPGSDIGARINAAFASVPGSAGAVSQGVVVNLAPDKVYTYSTPIRIPNVSSSPYIMSPVLDCHNAILRWAATAPASDQLIVMGENSYKSGEIRNCRFLSANPASTITFYSRIDFTVSHSQFDVPVRFINDTTHGGPGYTEQNHWDDIELSAQPGTCGVTFEQAPGLVGGGSFFYNWFSRIHLSLNGNSSGFCLKTDPVNSPGIQGGSFDLHVNGSESGVNNVFALDPGTSIGRGVVEISGEKGAGGAPTYDVYASSISSVFYNFGSSNPGFPHHYGPGVPQSNITFIGPEPISDDLGTAPHATRTISGEPGGTAAQRICENLQVGTVTAFLLAAYSGPGGENNCTWEVAYRNTDNTWKDVDVAGTSGNPITTRIWTSSQTGVGFGPNYGTTKPNILPRVALETSGGFGITTPRPVGAGSGAYFQQSIEPSTGNLTEYFFGGVLAGQPSYTRREQFYDLTSGSVVTGFSRYAAGHTIHYALPTLKLGSGPELTGVQGSTGSNLAAAAGRFTPGDAVTTDANGNLVDAGAAFTGDKTAGSCTFHIVKGLIVAVTGC